VQYDVFDKRPINIMSVTTLSRKDFLAGYSFPRNPTRDFERDGHPAEFASGHPWTWEWCSENEIINFGKDLITKSERSYKGFHSALSSDQKLLAISLSYERVLVYDLASKELRATLEGCGQVVFKPAQQPDEHGYSLISSISDHESRSGISSNRLVLWDLDQYGRILDEEEPIDTAAFASKAIEAILPELISEYEWTTDFVEASNLHTEFEKALGKAASDHQRRHHTSFKNAQVGKFDSVTFSDDGRLLLYHCENGSTQHGMREPNKLPHVVVYDINANKEVHRLRGHTDAIMWSAISPEQHHIASVSWDGTMRMYSANTGDLIWVTDSPGGQSWAGAFTPDSKHIIWSSKMGRVIEVLNVDDGHVVSTFQEQPVDWCRHFTWHPDSKQVALCFGKHAYVWRPFDESNGTISQYFVLDEDKAWRGMAAVQAVRWMENGRALALHFAEGTNLVYDLQANSKEVFARPKSVENVWSGFGFYGVLSGPDQPDFYLSVDGDAKVRCYRTSVPAFPSWWEKAPEEKESTTPTKKMYPETGKYVKITKVASKEVPRKDARRTSWADKGAGLWTAE
jgi:WD40 repeat protein